MRFIKRRFIRYSSAGLLDHRPFCRERDIVFTKFPGGKSNTAGKCVREREREKDRDTGRRRGKRKGTGHRGIRSSGFDGDDAVGHPLE